MFGRKEDDDATTSATSTPSSSGAGEAPRASAPGAQQSVIGNTCRIVGDITASGTIRIEGNVEGNIRASERIEVGKSANVKGTLSANAVAISGSVSGAVAAADTARLAVGSRLDGDVSAKRLAVDEGAVFNGRSVMDGSGATFERSRRPGDAQLEVVKPPKP